MYNADMVDHEMRIGLLSTAKDPRLVGQTATGMGLVADTTEVLVVTNAGNKNGRAQNRLADRAKTALSLAGFTAISEVDVEKDGLKERLVSDSPAMQTLVVLAGGEKDVLMEALDTSGAGEVIKSDAAYLLGISAGSSVMGETLNVTGAKVSERPSGLGIVPAVVVCHFGPKKETEMLGKISEGNWAANTIIGISDRQALVGSRDSGLLVVGDGAVAIFERMQPGISYEKKENKIVVF